MKFLKVQITLQSKQIFDTVVDHLQTSVDTEEGDDRTIVSAIGELHIEVRNDEEIFRESFTLGKVHEEVQLNFGIQHPFSIELVELDEKPKWYK